MKHFVSVLPDLTLFASICLLSLVAIFADVVLASGFYSGRESSRHRRSIYTEGKAKVVASVWGKKIIQFLAASTVLPRTSLNKR